MIRLKEYQSTERKLMKIESVKENVNFRRAYHKGKSFTTPVMSVYWRKTGAGKQRLGITVSKKIGNSPCRNRLRRIIRAAAYNCRDILPRGCDIIIVARSAMKGLKSTHIERQLRDRFENN